MGRMGNAGAAIAMVLCAGCGTVTECDCVAPATIVTGTVSGATRPVTVEVRVGSAPCSNGSSPTSAAAGGPADQNGSYRIAISPPPSPGPACLIVTASTVTLPLLTTTRRVDATITKLPPNGPQEIRVDLTLGTP